MRLVSSNLSSTLSLQFEQCVNIDFSTFIFCFFWNVCFLDHKVSALCVCVLVWHYCDIWGLRSILQIWRGEKENMKGDLVFEGILEHTFYALFFRFLTEAYILIFYAWSLEPSILWHLLHEGSAGDANTFHSFVCTSPPPLHSFRLPSQHHMKRPDSPSSPFFFLLSLPRNHRACLFDHTRASGWTNIQAENISVFGQNSESSE